MRLPAIRLTKIWSDHDALEFQVEVRDGASIFSNRVYVGHETLRECVSNLDAFKDQAHGGVFDLRFGEFGPEYASGAIQARLHFHARGEVAVTVNAQSEFIDFHSRCVASEATLFLSCMPASLINFIRELRAISEGQRDDAELVGAKSDWSVEREGRAQH